MRVSHEQIRECVTNLINKAGRSPFLFLGSGFSHRYLGTDSWDGLLRAVCSFYSADEFLFDKYRAQVRDRGDASPNPHIAALMEKDLLEAVLSDSSLSAFRDEHIQAIRDGQSLVKIVAAWHIDAFAISLENDELIELRKAGKRRISGVITTNYDELAERLFPEFKVFVGQEDLLFQRLYEVGEIYKIHGSTNRPQSMILNAADYQKLDSQQAYLVAKLLTIFVEYPVIFMGYSVNDPDVRSILQSLANCLSPSHLSELSQRLVFVARGDDDISDFSLDFGASKRIGMTRICTNDFGLIYKGIADSHDRYAPRLLRDLKKQIYEFVVDADDKQKINVSSLSGLDRLPEDAEIIIGIGSPSSKDVRYGHVVTAEQLYRDVILDDDYLIPKYVVEEYLPDLLRSNNGGLPMYKYLALYDGEVSDPRMLRHLKEKESVDSFLHTQQRGWKERYRKANSNLSVQSILETMGSTKEDKAYEKLLFLNADEIDLEQLRSYLEDLLRADRNILSNNSELRRLIRIYDFLKYKDAPATVANSESQGTPS